MALDLEQLHDLISLRPYKWTEEQVDYRPSEAKGPFRCGACFHHFRRVTDLHGVCEVVRSERIDREGIDPDYVCDFYSKDGEKYPLAEDSSDYR